MARDPRSPRFETELPPEPEPRTGPSGPDRNAAAPTNRLYDDHLMLRREVMRLHDEVARLHRDRLELEGVDDGGDDEDDRTERPALPIRLAEGVRRHPIAGLVAATALVLALPIAHRFFGYLNSYEATDNAQVDAHIDPVSARIGGTIVRVYVDDNQHVKAGDMLAEIDPRDNQVAVEQARAQYDQTLAQVEMADKDYATALAMVQGARAADEMAQHDYRRLTDLSNSGVASTQQYEQASANAKVDSATVAAELAAAESAGKVRAARTASVAVAKAALDQASLNLGYTRIVAPVAGTVGRRTVEIGQRVAPGQELLAIVRDDDMWVTANFKETQLARVKPGERVTIYVDTFGADFVGHVESLAGASGEKYSLLPPENATGNYVKVVQRIPVRIRLDPQQDIAGRLRPGMSVEATVWIK
jgi:membrane fusion protein, multidrug efflux system